MYDFYHTHYKLDIVQMMYEVLEHYGLENIKKSSKKVPIVIESFEPQVLKKIAKLTDLPLIQLLGPHQMHYHLHDVSNYAHGVGPSLKLMYEHDLLKKARAANLLIHPWFIRDE